ncbi:helix-turn-helix transcriptional regulator [Clostridium felsineum]|uniref:helix-turn-helix domain-containing protein n=1 Tax=Clostridium felsineum TaxID=36839 RepID=UPI00214D18C1|nr:helix-turn-helix transcriptional regulator [Clostridium felsineum]MCR3759347.1 helix-turn-helix transcriptional regulator [Clostridium felsineum]
MQVSILGQNIKMIREKKYINAYQLSKKAHVSASTISEIESGIRQNLNSSTVMKIANALDVSVDSLYKTENNLEYVVEDIQDCFHMILESEVLKLDDEELSDTEKKQLQVSFQASLDVIRLNRENTKKRRNKK